MRFVTKNETCCNNRCAIDEHRQPVACDPRHAPVGLSRAIAQNRSRVGFWYFPCSFGGGLTPMDSHAPIARAARVSTLDVETRLGSEFGRLINVSATGALVRTRAPFQAGRQCRLSIHLLDASPTLIVRVVRSQDVPVNLPGATSRLREYLVGVTFTEIAPAAKDAVASLCGPAFAQTE